MHFCQCEPHKTVTIIHAEGDPKACDKPAMFEYHFPWDNTGSAWLCADCYDVVVSRYGTNP